MVTACRGYLLENLELLRILLANGMSPDLPNWQEQTFLHQLCAGRAARSGTDFRFSPPLVQIQFFDRGFGSSPETVRSPRRQLAAEIPNAPWLTFPMNDRRVMVSASATVLDLIPRASLVLKPSWGHPSSVDHREINRSERSMITVFIGLCAALRWISAAPRVAKFQQ